MNKYESDILKILHSHPITNPEVLSKISGYSLGVVNRAVGALTDDGYLSGQMQLTDKAREEFDRKKPQRAIILAAGFGMRMVPINLETPKAFLKINGQYMIERQIKQLHGVGITEIYVVVGFRKERFEYLVDQYGVVLIENSEFASMGNLHSLRLAAQYMDNAYIVPCDVWCAKNPFDRYELYSWYMVSDLIDDDSEVRVNRKSELVKVLRSSGGNTMVGISYLLQEDAEEIRKRMDTLCCMPEYAHSFWEIALFNEDQMTVPARIVNSSEVIEINTYEQLRELDGNSEQLKSDAITTIQKVLHADQEDISDITVLKKGMTNRSFLFCCKNQKYIMRIPGEGTDQLVNRTEEAAVYQTIRDREICDDIEYINPTNGYKITKYIEGTSVCDPFDEHDVRACMRFLKGFHQMKLKVGHEFRLFEKIDFYESLWEGHASVYKDYGRTKAHVFALQGFIEQHAAEKVLTHIDAVPDNFLFFEGEHGQELRLIDWEYAGMQDPHVDIAMFCIYALYDKNQVDDLIDIYFENGCPAETRAKIYCYISVCGLLWSNWCEYKHHLGIDFGVYSLKQYRFAKDYYEYAMQLIDSLHMEEKQDV